MLVKDDWILNVGGLKKQRACVRCCFIVRKTASETRESYRVFTVTTQKTNSSLLNVKVCSHTRPKNASQVRPNIKWMLVIFLECESIVYQKYFPPGRKVKQHQYGEVLQHRLEEVCRKLSKDGANWIFFFAITMNISTLLCQCQAFWRLKMWLWSCSLFTFLAWSVIIFLVSDHERGATRAPCPRCFWHSWTLTGRPTCDSRKSFPAVFPAVAESLCPLHYFGGDQFEGDNEDL